MNFPPIHCLIAALIVSATWLEVARAEPILMVPCSKTTCEGSRDKVFSGAWYGYLTWVSPSKECPARCSTVGVKDGPAQVHVMGYWLDLVCQSSGGPPCRWEQKDFVESEAGRRILEMNRDE